MDDSMDEMMMCECVDGWMDGMMDGWMEAAWTE